MPRLITHANWCVFQARCHFRNQSGVGLVEILIAVLLLSFGFLAAAQMQVQGMRFSQGAYLESQAYFMISEMMDRMRANEAGVKGEAYNNKTTDAGASNPLCNINYCDPNGLATQDLYDWSSYLHNLRQIDNFVALLPGTKDNPASGAINVKSDGVFTLTVSWNEKSMGENKRQSLSVDFAP